LILNNRDLEIRIIGHWRSSKLGYSASNYSVTLKTGLEVI